MFGPVPADVIGQPTAGAAQPGGAATEAGTAAAAGQQQDTETVAITAEQQTKSRQNESESAVGQAQAATNQSPANLQEGNDAARGQPQAQQEQATETAEVGAVLPAEVTRALQADMEGSVVDGGQQQAQSAAGKNTEPNALDYTPKQYAEAWLRWSAQINGVSLSEVREMQGDEAGLKAIEQLWVDAVLQEAKSGKQLLRKTLDKFLEVRPNSQLPETAFPDGYQRPEARKIEKEEVAARKAKPLTQAQQAQDGNGAMFSRSDAKPVTNPTAVKMRRAMVQRTVDALAKGWAKAPNVTVVDSMQDERVPEAVRKADAAQRSQGAMGEPEGFWYRGQVYLVAGALPTSADAARVLYHEVLGHHGLRGHFGKDLDRVLDQVIKLRRKDVQAKAQEYGLDMSNPEHAGYAAEEVLAELAQSRPDLGFVQRAIAAIRNFLRTHVPGFKVLELTDADIVQGYLLPARGWVERGADAGSAADGSMFSRSGGPDTEAQRQFKATERTYGGKAAYDRAKAAGKTKLTYGQWVQVRTPNFKAWFGDWEAVRAQERLDVMEPVQVRVPDAWRGLGHAELRQKMAEELDRMVREKTQIEHPELGMIRVGRAGAKKSQSTSRDPAKVLVAADLENVLPAAFHARSDAPDTKEQGVHGYSTLLARVDVDGSELIASFSVRQQQDGAWYYNTVTLKDVQNKTPVASPRDTPIAGERATSANIGVSKEKAQDSYGSPGARSRPLGETPIAGLSDFIRRPLARVNPEAVSKVVDSATGEPLVVYHGTAADFDAFDNKKTGVNDRGLWDRGHYFSAFVNSANSYALRQGDGARIIPSYVSIKNSFVLTTGSDRVTRLPDGRNYRELVGQNLDGAKIKELALEGGHDGVIQIHPNGAIGDLVVYSPEQIKSATGNNGQFDPANPDIRFSRSAAPSLSEVAETGRDTAWTGPAASKWDDFIYKMQDKHIDTKRALEAVRATQQKILI